MHRLLQRQLKKCRGTPDVPPEWAAFVEAVDLAYAQADADRELIERSMELSSQELVERNAELLGRNTELSAMREAALDCIISIDQAGQVVDFNPAAETTFGYSRREVVGRELAELIVPPRFREV